MKQQITTLLIIMMNLTSMLGQEIIDKTLIYVTKDDKMGFINFNEKEIIPLHQKE